MEINQYTYYYFVGIGGIGMSALARYFHQEGKQVLGYDKTQTSLTLELEKEGIEISYNDDSQYIPQALNPENTLVIYTPAIKKLAILETFQTLGFTIIKRSVALAKVTQNTRCIAIAGTHGKTTTTTLLAYILKEADFPVQAFLGGISENYQTNFINNGNQYSLVEADEFDKSFLQLSPYFACITSVDADHLDIYENPAHFQETFQQFADLMVPEGTLFLKKDLPITHSHKSYAIELSADYYATDIRMQTPYSIFNLQTPTQKIADCKMPLHGLHNIENATVAIAMALELGIESSEIKKSLKNFKGIKRRFTTTYFPNGKVYIDDYAHHPTELKAAIESVNSLFPTQNKLFLFQPHLYSRTRDFAEDFAKSLRLADHLILLDIYPAREEPIEGINSQWLASKINADVQVSSLENAMNNLDSYPFEVIVTLGAGNIDTLSPKITEKLEHET